ncbi:MAG: hypothetical protein WC610_02535 [Patescibacteria group bacterium]
MTQKNWIIIAIIIILVVIIGGVAFGYQNLIIKNKDQVLSSLGNQVSQLQNQIKDLQQNQLQNQNTNANVNADNENQSDWQTYTYPVSGLTIQYPKNWKAKDFTYAIGFYLPNMNPSNDPEGLSIEWRVYQNPQKLSLEKFFNDFWNPKYFNQAQSIKNIMVDGISGKELKGVGGMLTYTIALIPRDTVIVELRDNREENQVNGIFDKMLNSIKF